MSLKKVNIAERVFFDRGRPLVIESDVYVANCAGVENFAAKKWGLCSHNKFSPRCC